MARTPFGCSPISSHVNYQLASVIGQIRQVIIRGGVMRKEITWLHISDIHFNPKTDWRDNVTRNSLISYLETEFNSGNSPKPDLIFCTGDIAYGETCSCPQVNQYIHIKAFFDSLLEVCGQGNTPLLKERLFMVPGNHDVNRERINSDAQASITQWAKSSAEHASTMEQRFNDCTKEFHDTILRLDEYARFVKEYMPHHFDEEGRHRYAKIVEIDHLKIGIAGFNSAWTCAGPEDDRNLWLAAEWQFNRALKDLDKAHVRIGLIHHPVDWMNATDRDIATRRISTDFHFWLHGHNHKAWVSPAQRNITIAAGAVSAQTSDEFGFNIVHFDLSAGKGEVHLHQHKAGGASWTIAPVETHAPRGCWPIDLQTFSNPIFFPPLATDLKEAPIRESTQSINQQSINLIDHYLTKRLDEALLSFSSQPRVWVEPVLRKSPEFREAEAGEIIDLSDLVSIPKSTIIKAPPQFGLTCLAHHLIRKAWRTHRSLWLYLDSKNLKPHLGPIKEVADKELNLLGCEMKDVKCIVLDSWTSHDKDSFKLINKIVLLFPNTPIIIMQTDDGASLLTNSNDLPIGFEFDVLYLWSLPRGAVRKVVAEYNETRYIGDEDSLTTRLVSDLEMLNIHRTPLNCLTLLKVAEVDFDESPVNRTEMIGRVLFLLFNADDIPTYKVKPDLKDCEYVLGYFCEIMLRENNYHFSREHFLCMLQEFCKEQFIDLEIQVVFDVLHANNILIKRDNMFCFRFSYWIYYFAAQRMLHDENFAKFIFEDMRYAKCPEMIEFYTGIDRRREDALRVLIKDLRTTSEKVKVKSGLPDGLNPYKFAQWKPSSAMLEQMQNEISNGILNSNLPDSVKDRYTDRLYNPVRPYHQEIREILDEYSFVYMMRTMRAGSKALRNSDYVDPIIRRQLLQEILRCWEQATKVLLILLPFLAERGRATFEGGLFLLADDFGETPEERFNNILPVIPQNIISWSKDDLFSLKMGPLLIDQISREESDLKRHAIALLLINHRPRGWKLSVQKYITSITKNSFYLLDIYICLRTQYQYSFASSSSLNDIEYLIKMAAAKHTIGVNKPGVKLIRKVSNEVIPPRAVDIDI